MLLTALRSAIYDGKLVTAISHANVNEKIKKFETYRTDMLINVVPYGTQTDTAIAVINCHQTSTGKEGKADFVKCQVQAISHISIGLKPRERSAVITSENALERLCDLCTQHSETINLSSSFKQEAPQKQQAYAKRQTSKKYQNAKALEARKKNAASESGVESVSEDKQVSVEKEKNDHSFLQREETQIEHNSNVLIAAYQHDAAESQNNIMDTLEKN
uniref:Uncharacterized protein n=1 Tax=Tetranychus urticae TaxID=32264 RepID=T1L540_TETUR